MAKPWLAYYKDGVPQTIDSQRFSLPQMLERSCRATPDKPALRLILRHLGPISVGGSLTYRQVADQVNHFAAAGWSKGTG